MEKFWKIILFTVITLLFAIGIYRAHFAPPEKEYNYVDLGIQYAGCTVCDKYTLEDTHMLIIENKYNPRKKYSYVRVTSNIYNNVYFIGDTIKRIY